MAVGEIHSELGQELVWIVGISDLEEGDNSMIDFLYRQEIIDNEEVVVLAWVAHKAMMEEVRSCSWVGQNRWSEEKEDNSRWIVVTLANACCRNYSIWEPISFQSKRFHNNFHHRIRHCSGEKLAACTQVYSDAEEDS